MGRTFQSATIGILTMLCIFTVAAHASASVSNPGSFDFNIEPGHDSLFRFKSGQQILIDGSGTSYISANIDSNGDFSGVSGAFSSAIMPNSGTPISALLQLQSGSGGVIVPQTADLEFVLKFRVRFSYNGSAACTTDEFSVRLDTSTWASSGAGACSTGYSTTNGDFAS